MSNEQRARQPRFGVLGIGRWAFTGCWSLIIGISLVISHWSLVIPKALASAEDTNLPPLSAATNSLTNLESVPALDTNAIAPLAPVDTNTLVLTPLENAPPRGNRPNARLDLQSFRIIWERNIFNPNRSPRFARRQTRARESRAPVESFALVGTMSYEKGRFAFFEGSSSQYQKVLEASDSIAGYKVAEVAPSYVKLQSTNGQSIELPVGMQMKRQEEGEWTMSSRPEAPSVAAASTSGDASDALKRLMERREQEAGSEGTNASTNATTAPLTTEEKTETTNTVEKTEPASNSAADEILKKLLQKREQERQ